MFLSNFFHCSQSWRQVYAETQLTKFYSDTFFEEVIPNNPKDVPIDNTTSRFAGKLVYFAGRKARAPFFLL
jgi:hypothetical protein